MGRPKKSTEKLHKIQANLPVSQYLKLKQYAHENHIDMTTAINLWINTLKVKDEIQVPGQMSLK